MSIIYDALQKVEKKTYSRGPQNRTRLKMALTVIVILIGGILIYLSQGRLSAKAPKAQEIKEVSAPAAEDPKVEKPKASFVKNLLPVKKEDFKENSFRLSGIIYSKYRPSIAIINNKRVSQGQTIEKATVSKIQENSVTLNVEGKNMILNIE